MVLNVHRNNKGRGEGGGGRGYGGGGGEGDYIPNAILSPPESVILALNGSDESHFNVSVGSDGQSHKTVSFEEKGEPKRYRPEVLPLTSLTPYH